MIVTIPDIQLPPVDHTAVDANAQSHFREQLIKEFKNSLELARKAGTAAGKREAADLMESIRERGDDIKWHRIHRGFGARLFSARGKAGIVALFNCHNFTDADNLTLLIAAYEDSATLAFNVDMLCR